MAYQRIRRRSMVREEAGTLYGTVVAQSRLPVFYASLGVPDSVDGRFDMIALHAWLVMRRLRREGARGPAAAAQALFDTMFADMDRSLRELGAGDLGVGRRVKAMARAFYGRADAYDAGLAGEVATLEAALRRNLYGTVAPAAAHVSAMAGYLRCQDAALAAQPAADIVGGRVAFDAAMAGAGAAGEATS